MIKIEKATSADRDFIVNFHREHSRAEFIVTRGRKVYVAEIEALIARDDAGNCVGMLNYEFVGDACEVVSLEAIRKQRGIGTQLMDQAKTEAGNQGCRRLWLITTNDNLEALRFYQRRGFLITAVHVDAIAESRKLKPAIPKIGNFGIEIRDEIELELVL